MLEIRIVHRLRDTQSAENVKDALNIQPVTDANIAHLERDKRYLD